MDIEKELFKKCIIDDDQLMKYGFKKIDGKYIYSKNILDDTFRVDIEVQEKSHCVNGKIYDLSFDEEYVNYRMDHQMGEFVCKVREEFKNILFDIKEHCCRVSYFNSNQANRIASYIQNKYGDVPQFVWDKFPGYGLFKNSNNKWYGLIMNMKKSKLDFGDEEVEALNVKLHEDKIKELLKRDGFYKAYHMNKDKWITIILNDTIKDEEIMSCIEESHAFSEQVNEWIIPANPNYYDMFHCFDEDDTVFWKQTNRVSVGDIIYLYITKPYAYILYKCVVLEVDIPYEYKDDNLSMSKVMKLKLLDTYDKDQYTFDKLKEYGIKIIRGPRYMPKQLSIEMNK